MHAGQPELQGRRTESDVRMHAAHAEVRACDAVLPRDEAMRRMRSVRGSMPGRMRRNSSPRGPAGRLSALYLPVSIPARPGWPAPLSRP